MKVYEVLNRKVIQKRISKTDLAKKVGIDYELVRRSLNGKRKISADEFVIWCNVLGLKLKDFTTHFK